MWSLFYKNYDLVFGIGSACNGKDKEKAFTIVKKKYDRRINRLLNSIEKSSKILIVYLEVININDIGNEENNDSQIVEGYRRVLSTYTCGGLFKKKNIDMIYIHHSPEATIMHTDDLCRGLRKITLNYRLNNLQHNSVDFEKLKKIFRKIRLR